MGKQIKCMVPVLLAWICAIVVVFIFVLAMAVVLRSCDFTAPAYAQVPKTSGEQSERDPYRAIRSFATTIVGTAEMITPATSVDVTIPRSSFRDTTDYVVLISARKVQGSSIASSTLEAYVTRLSKSSFRITKFGSTAAGDTLGYDWAVIER